MNDNTNPLIDPVANQNNTNQNVQGADLTDATSTSATGTGNGNSGSVQNGNSGATTTGGTSDNDANPAIATTGGTSNNDANSESQIAASIIEEATKKFDIPKVIREKHQELIVMVLQTKSMDDKERQYWFHILPVMNEAQIEKLRTILVNEKVKLAEIDAKYGKKMDNAQSSQVAQMNEEEMKQRAKELKEKEAQHEKEEKEKEDALLAELANL